MSTAIFCISKAVRLPTGSVRRAVSLSRNSWWQYTVCAGRAVRKSCSKRGDCPKRTIIAWRICSQVLKKKGASLNWEFQDVPFRIRHSSNGLRSAAGEESRDPLRHLLSAKINSTPNAEFQKIVDEYAVIQELTASGRQHGSLPGETSHNRT